MLGLDDLFNTSTSVDSSQGQSNSEQSSSSMATSTSDNVEDSDNSHVDPEGSNSQDKPLDGAREWLVSIISE